VNPLFESAIRLQDFCRQRSWRFTLIGGIAVLRWGEPRLTRDADLELLTGFGNEKAFIDPLLKTFVPRFDDMRNFALRYRVVLLSDENGTPLDVSLAALPYEERTIERSSEWRIGDDHFLKTCSPEDLIVHKAFANRDHDWIDIEGIVVRQGSSALDWNLIDGEIQELLSPEAVEAVVPRLQKLRG